MAEEEFFTLDDDDLEEVAQKSSDKASTKKESGSKIIHYIIIGILVLTITLFALFAYLYIQKKNDPIEEDVNASKIIQNIQDKELTPHQESEAQRLLSKADKLFSQGKKEEALAIYEQLSHYNKALSYYNIGVAKLKEKSYEEAIDSFEKAMKSTKLKCASALNMSICYLNLKNEPRFQYFLTLSDKYLPYMINQPLYSYYYTLINYYKNQPIESLISIKNPTDDFYNHKQNIIASKALSTLKNDSLAIYYLIKNGDPKDSLTVGLLHARAGEYSLSADILQNAVNQGFEPLKANIALALVKNKLGLLKDSADILKSTYDAYKEQAENTYPISMRLKKSLFDPVIAQKEFKKRLFLDDRYRYSLLFYYAPYHAIDSTKTVNLITKGAKKIEIDSIKPALGYLTDSKAFSNVNLAVTEALKRIIENKIYEANSILKKAVKLYPAHSTLHYNLALTYAQIFDFQNAYKQFSKSYSLDSHNYKALAFKTFCASLTNKNIPKKELEKLKARTEKKEVLALIEIALGSLGLDLGYLDPRDSTFAHAINLSLAYSRDDYNMYKTSAQSLKNLLEQDLVSNILYLDATNEKSQIKTYARAIHTTLTQKKLDLSPLYFGGFLPKELYIRMLHIAGISSVAKKQLTVYEKAHIPTIPLLQSLAYTYIYNQNFEEAYKIYNTLIDNHQQKDSHTLFLASIAALGSNHHANAVALLELAKLTDDSNFESRYALGLLYQEAQNLEGASIQYKKIGNTNFQSNYFTFNLKK
ncbi:MAG TPA: tetratricopeptide repeat protein [Campylobacterales bacterium]|nr:tetratricopeptide repeat protein [Campylobacterales bacterium]